jgi:hypothetical protein
MHLQQMAKILGSRGGRARARRLSANERRRIASLGGHARRQSIEAERRLISTLQYAAAVRELRGGPPRVVSMRAFKGPLPRIRASSRSDG